MKRKLFILFVTLSMVSALFTACSGSYNDNDDYENWYDGGYDEDYDSAYEKGYNDAMADHIDITEAVQELLGAEYFDAISNLLEIYTPCGVFGPTICDTKERIIHQSNCDDVDDLIKLKLKDISAPGLDWAIENGYQKCKKCFTEEKTLAIEPKHS